MPRPPFILSREAERAAIDRVIRDPTKQRLLYEMVDAVLRISELGTVSRSDLASILAGLEVKDEGVWGRATGWLAKLHAFSPDLSATVDELAHHRNAVVRFNLCASLDQFPAEVAIPHLRRFLSDRSARVRGAVLNVAVKAGYRQLIPDFEAFLAEESDAERQQDIRQAIALLRNESFVRDGWQVRRLPNGDIESTPLINS